MISLEFSNLTSYLLFITVSFDKVKNQVTTFKNKNF